MARGIVTASCRILHCGARTRVVVHWLWSSTGSGAPRPVRSQLPEQGSELHPLQCQGDSQPLDPQGGPSSWLSEDTSDSVWFSPYLSACPCASLPHLRSLESRGRYQGPIGLKVFRSHVAFWVLHYLTENKWAEKAEKSIFKLRTAH